MTNKLILLYAAIMIITTSCMNNAQEERKEEAKQEEQNEAEEAKSIQVPEKLLGSWKLEMPGEGEGVPDQLFRRKFFKGGNDNGRYEIYWIATLPEYGPTVMAGEKGELSVILDTIFMTPTAFGSQQMGPMADDYYDTTRWYYPGDSLFDMFRNDPYGLFYIEGDTLFWKKDLNNDGQFLDQNEVTRFVREKK
jgi:hypothetical protein